MTGVQTCALPIYGFVGFLDEHGIDQNSGAFEYRKKAEAEDSSQPSIALAIGRVFGLPTSVFGSGRFCLRRSQVAGGRKEVPTIAAVGAFWVFKLAFWTLYRHERMIPKVKPDRKGQA